MDKLDWLGISSALYITRYLLTLNWNPYKTQNDRLKIFEIIPPVIYFILARMSIPTTDHTLFKHALLIMFTMQIISLYALKHLSNRSLHSLAYLSSLLLIIALLIGIKLPLIVLNVILIVLMLVLSIETFVQYKIDKSKNQKEYSEIYLLFFIAILALCLGTNIYGLFIGTLLLIVYQASELALTLKAYRNTHESRLSRLADLETKFERVVEFESKKRTSVMVDHVEYIREKSLKDPMTKALNRNGITSEINSLTLDQNIKMFSIAIFDIDFFKQINDTKGHMVGDDVLKYLSYTFMTQNRKIDTLGRYGGDEFIFVMPHLNAPAAIEVCERMRKEIVSKSSPKFTISIGIASYPYDGKSFSSLLEIADLGLYKAKNDGRNCIRYVGNVPNVQK